VSISDSKTDAAVIADVALASAEPKPLEDDQRYVVTVPDGSRAQVLDRVPDAELLVPRRKRGTVQVLDVPSYVAQYGKHAGDTTETFADPKAFTITAVLNADDADTPAHRDHRLILSLKKTPQWLAWENVSGKMLAQVEFAEFLEERAIDVRQPTSAEVLELAQHFEAKTNVDFKSGDVLSSGQRQLVYEETVQAKAGQKGDLEIPTQLELALQPFEGGDTFKVIARFRYRINNGRLALGVALERPEDILKLAFTETCEVVGAETSATVLLGTAPGEVR